MYINFTIDNFRCFEDTKIGPLAKINLITGKNGSGKTALLEAIWLNHGFHNPELGIRVDAFRGLDRFRLDEIMLNLFRHFDYNKSITISGELTNKKKNKLVITSSHLHIIYLLKMDLQMVNQ